MAIICKGQVKGINQGRIGSQAEFIKEILGVVALSNTNDISSFILKNLQHNRSP